MNKYRPMALLIRFSEYGKQKYRIENSLFDILKIKTKELESEDKVIVYSKLEVLSALKPIH